MKHDDRIFVAGHRGLAGSAIVRKLTGEGYTNLLVRTHDQLDLRRHDAVHRFFAEEKPAYVFLAAARVGGIVANDTYRGEFIHDNLLIQTSVIDAAHRSGVQKLVFLGSSCIYPKLAPQPIKEDYLLTGPLEPTNSAYAIAKIAGIEMIDAYRRQYGFRAVSVMPTNLYGPNDSFDLERSHVLPALIRRFHEAKERGAREVVLWGTGTPRREFLHVDDFADACVFVMNHYDDARILNVGVGEDVTVRELAELVGDVVGYTGEIRFDTVRPDGTPRKLLDVARLHALGWRARIPLREGIKATYRWYLEAKPASSQAPPPPA
ncbi:MAG TPA: GDP-L-fucose synthase [Polyangiaceae bacterium]|jgi:GDP-L-fucose synthase|nr:GDP-L-fucose synthase [Polyangiaceae bacterium]